MAIQMIFSKEISTIKSLLPLYKLYPWRISSIVVLGILETGAEAFGISLFIPFLYNLNEKAFSIANDSILERLLNNIFLLFPPQNRLEIIAICIFAMILIRNSITYGKSLLSAAVSSKLNHHLRTQVFDQLLNVSNEYIEEQKSGKLWNTLENETYNTVIALTCMIDIIKTCVSIIVFGAVLLLLSWQYTFIVLTFLIAFSIIVKIATRRIEKLSEDSLVEDEKLAHRILEIFNGMMTIRLFGREDYEKKRFARISKKVSEIDYSMEKFENIVQPISELLVAGLLIFVLLTFLVESGNLPTVLVFIFILYRLHPQVMWINERFAELMSVSASIKAVQDVLNTDDKPYIQPGDIEFSGLKKEIRLKNLSFSYNGNQNDVLRDLSIVIPKNSLTAIVGKSGAGKTTLISLLFRIYDPKSGMILIDDLPLADMDYSSWRKRLAIVSQQPYIFSSSVRDNIAYGRLDASDDDIIKCAQKAAAHDFISKLSDGYQTFIGDSGVKLSTGQCQRIALARAFIRNPDILVLDEATNALDSLSEAAIQQTFQTMREAMTTIVIAHRLKTIEMADNIIVIEKGKIKEQGTATELIGNATLFAELYKLQE